MKWHCRLIANIIIEADTREEALELFFEGVCRNEYGAAVALTPEEAKALWNREHGTEQ